jgi:hypothetical protein
MLFQINLVSKPTNKKKKNLQRFHGDGKEFHHSLLDIFMSKGMQRPPYIDQKTGERFEISNPTNEGWLTKRSAWLKDWRRRYFLLKGSKLFFAKGEFSAPHGMIDLGTCMTVKSAELKAGKKNAIEVSTKEETFYMYADTEKEKDEWIGAIGRSIVQSSSTFTNEDGVDPDNYNSDDDGDNE